MSEIHTLPQLSLALNGQPLSDRELAALYEIRVQQRLSLPTLCEITFRDPPETLQDLVIPGASLHLEIHSIPVSLFSGEISGLEYCYGPAHEQELHLRASDPSYHLQMQQSIRPHIQTTPAEIAAELAAPLGLIVDAPDPGPLWQQCFQFQISDLDFLNRITGQSGLYWTVRENVLHLTTLEGFGQSLPLKLGKSLLEARFELNTAPDTTTVTARGWNPLEARAFDGQATHPRSGRTAAGLPNTPTMVQEYQLLNTALQDPQHAEALAQAELDRRAARRLIFRGIAEGDPQLRPATSVTLQGIASTLSGRYILTAVDHIINSSSGYISEISSAPPYPYPPEENDRIALGQVTRVNDPQNLGRIQVSLPAYNNIETPWMQVLSPGAGAQKGWVILPDVDDYVLVWLPGANPAGGVVLGGLYGMNGPYDSGIEENSVQRYNLRTHGGHHIRLDDTTRTIRIENSSGSYTEMAPDKVQIHAAADLEIEAPGKQILIRGHAIDFEEG